MYAACARSVAAASPLLEQPLAAVLAERLEHDEARLAVVGHALHEQAVVDERGDAVEDVDAQVLAGVADGLGRLERAAAGEDRQAAKELLLGRCQQVVAPLDRAGAASAGVPAGRARRRSAARAAVRCGPAVRAGGRILTRAAASSIASGRPSSRRQISTTAPAFFGVSAKSGRPAAARWTNSAIDAHSISAAGERQRVGSRERQRRDRELLLAVDVQHEAAGHQHLERGTGVEQFLHEGRGIGHLLEVVHEQERRAEAAKVLGDRLHQREVAALANAERPGDGRRHQPWIGNRREVDERHAAVEVIGRDRRPPEWPGASSRCRLARSASAAGRRNRAACP